MALASAYKVHRIIGNNLELVEVEYDFANDAGATGALDLIKFEDACVLVDAYLKVETAFTSGGAATLIWGIKGGDTDACLDATSGAVAALTIGAVLPGETASHHIKIPADSVMEMTIGTAAMTAGKGKFVMIVQKF